MSNVFRALADPTRRSVLQLLRQRPMTAGELAEHFDVTKPTMSAHFAVLLIGRFCYGLAAGTVMGPGAVWLIELRSRLVRIDLIEAEKNGRSITYRLKMSVLEEALMEFARAVGFTLPVTKSSDRSTIPKRGNS